MEKSPVRSDAYFPEWKPALTAPLGRVFSDILLAPFLQRSLTGRKQLWVWDA